MYSYKFYTYICIYLHDPLRAVRNGLANSGFQFFEVSHIFQLELNMQSIKNKIPAA